MRRKVKTSDPSSAGRSQSDSSRSYHEGGHIVGIHGARVILGSQLTRQHHWAVEQGHAIGVVRSGLGAKAHGQSDPHGVPVLPMPPEGHKPIPIVSHIRGLTIQIEPEALGHPRRAP